jgi:hypothetical protein
MTTFSRRPPRIRSKTEAEFAQFAAWGKKKGSGGARSWRPWKPAEARRQGQRELPLPIDPRQAVRESIEQAQKVPRQARIPKATKRRRSAVETPETGGEDE